MRTEIFKTEDREGNIIQVINDCGFLYPAIKNWFLISVSYGYSFTIEEALKKLM